MLSRKTPIIVSVFFTLYPIINDLKLFSSSYRRRRSDLIDPFNKNIELFDCWYQFTQSRMRARNKITRVGRSRSRREMKHILRLLSWQVKETLKTQLADAEKFTKSKVSSYYRFILNLWSASQKCFNFHLWWRFGKAGWAFWQWRETLNHFSKM